MNSRKLRLYSVSLLLASMILFAVAAMQYQINMIGQIKGGGPEDPLEAWSEASYIILNNSTHYAARNMSTLLVDFGPSTNASEVANNALSAADGVFFFKAGNYTLTGSITPDSGDIIKGEGNNTVLTVGAGLSINAIKAIGTAGNYLTDIDIMDIRIVGNEEEYGADPDKQNGILLKYVNETYISNVYVEKVGHLGAFVEYGRNPIIQNSIFINCEYGVEFGATERGQMIGVKALDNDMSGILVESGWANVICACIAADNAEHGLGAEGEARLTIVGGVYENNGNQGIDLNNCSDSIVTSLTTRYNTGDGVKLRGSTNNCSVTSNELVHDQGYGVKEQDTANGNWIANNGMWDCGLGGVLRIGANTEVAYNRGYITENCGYTSASNGDWIDHNLVAAPTAVVITVKANDARYIAQVNATTATQFQLYLWDDTASELETVDKTIMWYAEYRP